MTAPDCDPSVCAKAQASASEGGKPQRDAREGVPTLSRRSLLLQGVSLLVLYVATVPSPAAALGLPKSLSKATVQQMKDKARRDVKAVLDRLNRDLPGVVKQVAATAGGIGLGSLGSTALLHGLGTPGLAAPGITTALAAAGGWVSAGLGALGVTVVSPMVAGVVVLSAPVLVGRTLLRWGANKMKGRGTKTAKKLEHAIQELKTIEARLKPPRHFRDEIAEIKTYIKELERQKPKMA